MTPNTHKILVLNLRTEIVEGNPETQSETGSDSSSVGSLMERDAILEDMIELDMAAFDGPYLNGSVE